MLANLNITASCWWSELYNCHVSVIFSAGTKLDAAYIARDGKSLYQRVGIAACAQLDSFHVVKLPLPLCSCTCNLRPLYVCRRAQLLIISGRK